MLQFMLQSSILFQTRPKRKVTEENKKTIRRFITRIPFCTAKQIKYANRSLAHLSISTIKTVAK